MIVVLAGLPGTGKTTLARELAARLGGAVLNKDSVRAALFEPGFVEYSAEQDDFVQELMFRAAGYLLAHRPDITIFFDGRTFSRAYQIDDAIRSADALNTPWKILECVCSEETVRNRLNFDAATGGHPARNRNFQLYLSVRGHFEPIVRPKLVIDTDLPVEDCVNAALAYVRPY